ncbi:MAG: hypothetical protein HLX50_03635, partial [Alteromonadaceae bacterium]|nr:hypothetical protein [Alteromonadaceae bacterium]
ADFQQHEQIAEQFAHEHRQRLNRQAAHDEATASAPRADRLDSQSNDKKQEPMPARKFPTVVGKRLSDIQGKMETAAEERDSAKSAERDAAQAVSIATAELEQIRGWFKKRRRREATQRLDSAQERHAKAERHTQAAEAQYASLSREYRQLREKAASIQPGSERSTIRKQRFQPPAPTPEAKTAQQPQRETWHELEKRAQAAIDEVLSNPNRHERAALIRQAVTHDDERYAEAFEEAMIERGIGVHGELSPAAQREQQQREQQPSDKEMSQHIEHAREDLSGPGSRNGGPSL